MAEQTLAKELSLSHIRAEEFTHVAEKEMEDLVVKLGMSVYK